MTSSISIGPVPVMGSGIISKYDLMNEDSKWCRDHSGLHPTQALCTGFSTAMPRNVRLSHSRSQVGCSHCSQENV